MFKIMLVRNSQWYYYYTVWKISEFEEMFVDLSAELSQLGIPMARFQGYNSII